VPHNETKEVQMPLHTEQDAARQLAQWRTRESVHESDGWRLAQWASEQRDGEPVFGFVVECQESDAGCDVGDSIAGYLSPTGVAVETVG
jgi:hypothetical protein